MSVEELFQELELVLSDICFSGLRNVQPALLLKLKSLKGWLEELGMTKGGASIDAFSGALGAYQLGESGVGPAVDALCALEFYCRNVINYHG